MLTNIPGGQNLSGYQAQLTTPKVNSSNAVNETEKSDPTIEDSDDTVRISRRAEELNQTYREKENSIEQRYDANRQKLEREYAQEKNELEREFTRKKQALNVNLYV